MSWLTWIFISLSALCVVLIGVDVVLSAIGRLRIQSGATGPLPQPGAAGLGAAVQQGLDPSKAIETAGKVAEQFGKAGSVGTLAALALTFALFALLAGGILKASVN
jgi:hypothetical protein